MKNTTLDMIKEVSRLVSNNKLKQIQVEETLLFQLAIETKDLTLRSLALQRKVELDKIQIEMLGGK